MNQLVLEKRVRVTAALVEGNSIRATVRMTGVAKNTVVKLLAGLGAACRRYHDAHVRGLEPQRVQCDEIWSFCYSKEKNVPDHMRGQEGVGSVWTWTGMDAESKLMIAYHVGSRDAACCRDFIDDLADRITTRVQLTTDGYRLYVDAVSDAFGAEVDYAMLVKLYGEPRGEQARYSPCECVGSRAVAIIGQPVRQHISTSYVERQNLTMRMGMRRFTRLTNAFSKKIENLRHAVALHFAYYNFCRKHQTLGMTPAQHCQLTDHQWTLEELVGLLEREEATRN